MKKLKYGLLVGILLAVDLISKSILAPHLAAQGSVTVIPGFFSLTFVKNTGAAWGLLADATPLLAGVSILASALFIYFLVKANDKDHLTLISLSMMLAGTLGNMVDRLMLGYVRDFLDFILLGYDFPVFNGADCCLTIGVIILLVRILFFEDKGGEHGKA